MSKDGDPREELERLGGVVFIDQPGNWQWGKGVSLGWLSLRRQQVAAAPSPSEESGE